jgi:hypothetical protein
VMLGIGNSFGNQDLDQNVHFLLGGAGRGPTRVVERHD